MTEEEKEYPTASEVATNIFSICQMDLIVLEEIKSLKNSLANESIVKINEKELIKIRTNNVELFKEFDNTYININDSTRLEELGWVRNSKIKEVIDKHIKEQRESNKKTFKLDFDIKSLTIERLESIKKELLGDEDETK